MISVFVILFSVICYGIAYFPVFAALTLYTIPSLILGTLHAWMFTGIELYKSFECVYVYSAVSTECIYFPKNKIFVILSKEK